MKISLAWFEHNQNIKSSKQNFSGKFVCKMNFVFELILWMTGHSCDIIWCDSFDKKRETIKWS